MEQNIAQHTLTFSKGITNIPSDLLCPDDTLSEAEGLVLSDNEYKAMQAPASIGITSDATVKYVHELNSGSKNYIFWNSQSEQLAFMEEGDDEQQAMHNLSVQTRDVNITAVGNTLIVMTESSVEYYLWKGWKYEWIGDRIPEPKVHFGLSHSDSTVSKLFNPSDVPDDQNGRNDFYVGIYEWMKKQILTKRGFCEPFFLCYAVELTDGSYYLISNPILMMPAVEENHYISRLGAGMLGFHNAHLEFCTLKYKSSGYSEDWGDIVKDIVVFATDPVSLYDTSDNCVERNLTKLWSGIVLEERSGKDYYTLKHKVDTSEATSYYGMLVKNDKEEVKTALESSSVFYKLFSVGLKPVNSWSDASTKIRKHTLENLTTQDTLPNIDFYSHCSLAPNISTQDDKLYSKMQAFNRRLNLIGIRRTFFEGFDEFLRYNASVDEGQTQYKGVQHRYYVHIKTVDGERVVMKESEGEDIFKTWFYYPDPRAYKVDVFSKSGSQWGRLDTLELKEHSGLNGAYYLSELTDVYTDYENQFDPSAEPPHLITSAEPLPNYLLQSEVDNPFVFLASGYVRVGQGTILGIAGLTTALNQDAYMVATTLAFTTQGIWALSINGEGQYSGVNPPFSREVCNNPASITMTDNAVFFTSEKGLMCVTGTRETSVVCVSDALRNSDFVEFCRTCRIAYDYKESLLLLYQPGKLKCYIYNIKSGAWTTDDNLFNNVDTAFLTAVVDYPDTLIQTDEGDIFSLLKRPNRDADNGTTYSGTLVSRPCKLDGSQVLKSIRQLKLLYDIDGSVTDAIKNGKITLTIEGSNDCKNWHTLTSLRSKPFKFFRFRIDLKNIHATDTFTGLTLITQKRYTEKLI